MRKRSNGVTRRPAPAAVATKRAPKEGAAAIRILVADTLALDRRSLIALLATQPDFSVVGEAESIDEVARAIPKARPSLVILALRLGSAIGRTPVMDVRKSAPGIPVWRVAERGEGECLVRNPPTRAPGGAKGAAVCSLGTDCLQIAVAEGASGTIRRSTEPEVFFQAVRTVAAGNPWYEPRTASAI